MNPRDGSVSRVALCLQSFSKAFALKLLLRKRFSQTCSYPSVVSYHSSKPHNQHSFELLELFEVIAKITMLSQEICLGSLWRNSTGLLLCYIRRPDFSSMNEESKGPASVAHSRRDERQAGEKMSSADICL